jgi:hypothetical protein
MAIDCLRKWIDPSANTKFAPPGWWLLKPVLAYEHREAQLDVPKPPAVSQFSGVG